MARTNILRVLSYDVTCDRRRRRVARLLESEGTRVQWSVFELRVSDAKLASVVGRIQEIIDETDSLRVYTIGRSGEKKCRTHGATIPIDRDVGYWLM